MLIFDELKKNDPQLRFVAIALAAGFFILFAGLWWVQVVSAREYENHLEAQSYRTVRIPAVRGKILDCEGRVLAENQPHYDLSLYLDDLRPQFDRLYDQLHSQALVQQRRAIAAREKKLGHSLTRDERKEFLLNIEQIREEARFNVAQTVVAQVGHKLDESLTLDPKNFNRAYLTRRAMPYPILQNLDDAQIARFEEQYSGGMGVDLDLQPVRVYPFGATASHVLGYVQKDTSSIKGEDAFFNYRLPDYRGVIGIEGGFDAALHGHAGEEDVLVNNLGYRQTNNIPDAPEAGENVVLTIDLDIQRAAEESLESHQGADARAAIVVMDVRSGDILAMVSSPAIDPNYFTGNLPSDEWQKESALLNDPKLKPQINRATYGNYAPGSIFKPIVGLAALKTGLDPDALVDNPGYVYVGQRHITDLAPPGQYDLRRAIAYSCNTYFITVGLRAGITNIVRMAEKFHFGEKTDLPTRQESPGIFPSLKKVESPGWYIGNSANICIGQGQMAVTPIQMAVAYSAIANGGKVFWPRLVERIEPQNTDSGEAPTVFPEGVVRDELGVPSRFFEILHKAMLAETEEGTGQSAQVSGLQICGKTGTAQVMNSRNQEIDRTTWFASFAPYENPRYAVVVMMQGRSLWGRDCAPIAHDIYEKLLKKENAKTPQAVAKN
ncbi:MAG: penicillin-binding transpeptidase domain-containing protein [Limisphaerales bacterium]